jgi:hypothetical protein
VTLVMWAGQIGRALGFGQMLGQSRVLFGDGRMSDEWSKETC